MPLTISVFVMLYLGFIVFPFIYERLVWLILSYSYQMAFSIYGIIIVNYIVFVRIKWIIRSDVSITKFF